METVHLDMGGLLGNGQRMLAWSGENDAGQWVKGGSYYFKVEYADPFGATTSYVKPIQVVQGVLESRLDLYNGAGEVVAKLDLSSYGQAVTDFSLEKDTLALAYRADGTVEEPLRGSLRLADGSTVPFVWEGRGEGGRPVQAGSYRWVLRTETSAGTQVKSKGLTVLRAVDAGLSREPVLAPNPAHADATSGLGRRLQVRYPAGEISAVRLLLYNQAGEAVAGGFAPGDGGLASLGYEGVSGGVYLLLFEGRLNSGALYRRIFKVAIVR
jgi:flagellar hook assembly protein FlgD